MKKKELPDFIISELFLVKADWQRTYMGTIKREVDFDGNPVLSCKVIINEGMAWSRAADEEELRKNMDDICVMKLDRGLHQNSGLSINPM